MSFREALVALCAIAISLYYFARSDSARQMKQEINSLSDEQVSYAEPSLRKIAAIATPSKVGKDPAIEEQEYIQKLLNDREANPHLPQQGAGFYVEEFRSFLAKRGALEPEIYSPAFRALAQEACDQKIMGGCLRLPFQDWPLSFDVWSCIEGAFPSCELLPSKLQNAGQLQQVENIVDFNCRHGDGRSCEFQEDLLYADIGATPDCTDGQDCEALKEEKEDKTKLYMTLRKQGCSNGEEMSCQTIAESKMFSGEERSQAWDQLAKVCTKMELGGEYDCPTFQSYLLKPEKRKPASVDDSPSN